MLKHFKKQVDNIVAKLKLFQTNDSTHFIRVQEFFFLSLRTIVQQMLQQSLPQQITQEARYSETKFLETSQRKINRKNYQVVILSSVIYVVNPIY